MPEHELVPDRFRGDCHTRQDQIGTFAQTLQVLSRYFTATRVPCVEVLEFYSEEARLKGVKP